MAWCAAPVTLKHRRASCRRNGDGCAGLQGRPNHAPRRSRGCPLRSFASISWMAEFLKILGVGLDIFVFSDYASIVPFSLLNRTLDAFLAIYRQ